MKNPLKTVESAVKRATPAPFGVRVAVFGVNAAALLVALPVEVLEPRVVGVALLLALLPAVRPRGPMPTLVALATISCWLLATAAFGERIALWRVIALAALLYAGHSLAALAACLPYDALVHTEAVTGWVIRLIWVLLGSSVVLIGALAAAGQATIGGYAAFAIGGLVAAVASAALLARISR